jgi:hypothetical protein
MRAAEFSISIRPAYRKLAIIPVVLLFVSVIAGAICYLFAGYDRLVNWYLSLEDCFYKRSEWTTGYFTPEVKMQGNFFALGGILLAATALVLIFRGWRNREVSSPHPYSVSIASLPWYGAVVVLAVSVAVWEWNLLLPSNDEVFSVVKCTALHPFITLSYYMQPNNHIYFNVVNRLLFGWLNDFVFSGRLIAAATYVGATAGVYFLLCRLLSGRLFAFIALLPVLFGVYTLGFGVQARGYGPQLFCGIMAFIALMLRHADSGDRQLRVNAVFNIIGFMLIPSYLYFYLAQLMYLGFVMVGQRKIDRRFIWAQVATGAMVYLAYLPAICFSGLQSITSNGWVKPSTEGLLSFLPRYGDFLLTLMSEVCNNIAGQGNFINYLLFALPLALFFTKKSTDRRMALFYIALWVPYVLYTMVVKRIPFHRVLIVHLSLSTLFVVYTLAVIVRHISAQHKSKVLKLAAIAFLFVLPVGYYLYDLYLLNRYNATYLLYRYNINEVHTVQINSLEKIPQGSSVSFSEDAFYFYYYASRRNYTTFKCPSTSAQYFIKIANRPSPPGLDGLYTHFADADEDFTIYKKK